MSYEAQSALAADGDYRSRLTACLVEQATIHLEDPATPPADEQLSRSVIMNPTQGQELFAPVVAAAPGMADAFADGGSVAVTDGMLLAAVQSVWPFLAGLFLPPAVETGTPA